MQPNDENAYHSSDSAPKRTDKVPNTGNPDSNHMDTVSVEFKNGWLYQFKNFPENDFF